ncbi:nuclear pore glycoprotein p62 [Condylostylus longicornis]|uniref:nuclear pore glycoprotein p62 n=1 Tax=Condylostylus longicornis TaxID=2530218 RepID=UPI00244E4B7D|nr:nuclear pore glycoprotein p62 [Condylostylus longicornis]
MTLNFTNTSSNLPTAQQGAGDSSQNKPLGLSSAAATTTSITGGFQIAGVVSTTANSSVSQASTSAPQTTLSSETKTTDSSVSATQAYKLTFGQIEEHINKWTLELEEQEKTFTNQATQINAWDKLLISNNDKIIALNETVQKVKIDQQTLEQELEFIATQHAELEESIAPLQKSLSAVPQVDVERSQIYQLVENLDTQLKQMSEDLKEVIEYLNEATKMQDSSDPINQIGRILNAHMNSLQWIETSSSAISTKLDDISKMHEQLKRDSERSFRATYKQ